MANAMPRGIGTSWKETVWVIAASRSSLENCFIIIPPGRGHRRRRVVLGRDREWRRSRTRVGAGSRLAPPKATFGHEFLSGVIGAPTQVPVHMALTKFGVSSTLNRAAGQRRVRAAAHIWANVDGAMAEVET